MENYSYPPFAVLMAVYKGDSAFLFQRAIESVYLNTIQPDKFVIVVDGPITDALENILFQYIDKKNLCIVRLPLNIGLAGALNAGLNNIEFDYTIRADSDDFNRPNRFHKLMMVLTRGFDVVGSSILEVDKNGIKIAIRKLPVNQLEIVNFARKRNPFNHMSVGFRTKIVIDAGCYPGIHLKEDYALWATLIASGAKVYNLDEILVDATTGKDMYRRRGGVKYALAEIDMQRHLVHVGLKSFPTAVIDGSLRAFIFLMPSVVREFIYLKLLRVSAD